MTDSENPYQSNPRSEFRYRDDRDQSVNSEPHFGNAEYEIDPSEYTADQGLDPIGRNEPLTDRMEHSVWDEPGLNPGLTGAAPEGAVTYVNWLDYNVARTSNRDSWKNVAMLAAASGPMAIAGTFLMNQQSVSQSFVILLTVVGPLVEEVMKAAATLWAAEKRPFFFKSPVQILVCMAFSGLCFAVIENIIYLNFYIPNPANSIVAWRWSVCVALHTFCALITGVGISKMWRQAMGSRTRPRLPVVAPYMFTAFVVHGIYNFLALFLQLGS